MSHSTKFGPVRIDLEVSKSTKTHSWHYTVRAKIDDRQIGFLKAQEIDVRSALNDDGFYKLSEVLDETADLCDMSTFLYGVRALGLEDHVYDSYRKWKTFTPEFQALAANFRYSKPRHRNRWSDWDHKICYVSHVEVDPTYRCGGVGKLLFEALGKRRFGPLETFVVLKCSPIQGEWRNLTYRSPESWNMYVAERDQLARFYARNGFFASESNAWMVSTRSNLAKQRRSRGKPANLKARSASS